MQFVLTKSPVVIAQSIIVILVAASPLMLVWDGAITDAVLSGWVAAGVTVIAVGMRPGETRFFVSIIRRAALLAAIPVLWIVIQLLPLSKLENPIWSSARAALGSSLTGSITIDFGSTVMALGLYLSASAVVLLAAAIAVDRRRAVWVLFSLVGATALIALLALTGAISEIAGDNMNVALSQRAQAIDIAVIGTIIAATAGIRTLERNKDVPLSERSAMPLIVSCAAFVICAAALLASGRAVLLAALYGVGSVIAVAMVRRLRLRPLGLGAAAVVAIGAMALLIGNDPGLHTNGIALAFASPSPPVLVSASQRAINDAPWFGIGAGTFAAIMPVYREVNQPAMSTPPTAVAALTIELGWPMVMLIFAVALAAIFSMVKASLHRGRDSFYPAAGAGCLVSLLLLSFINPGALGTAVVALTATILGLALAQSTSRTS